MNPTDSTAYHLGQVIGFVLTAAAFVIACGVLWRYIVRPAWRIWRRSRSRLHAAAKIIDRELTPNGGGSLSDAVHRTEATVAELAAIVATVVTKVDDIGVGVDYLARTVDRIIDPQPKDGTS